LVASILRNRRVNLLRPGRNAALQIDHFGEAVLGQKDGHLLAAHAVVTQAGNGLILTVRGQ